jgi:hypothetical protein
MLSKKTIIVVFLLSILFSCKDSKKDVSQEKTSGIVLFALGEVTVAGKKIKAGDEINTSDMVKTAPKSYLDVQIKDSEITFRIKENSEFSFDAKAQADKKVISGNVQAGSVIFNVQKLKATEGFNVKSPTQTAGVRGTKLETSVGGNGITKTNVYEGKVATKMRISELDKLSEEDLRKSANLSKLLDKVDSGETVLDKGQSASIDKKKSEQLVDSAGLKDVISNLDSKNLGEIDKKVDVTKTEEKLSKVSTNTEVAQISKEEMDAKLKEFDQIAPIDPSKLSDPTALEKRNMDIKDASIKKIEAETGKQAETLILKNGNKILGVIYVEGGKYIVITPEGKKEFKASEVDSTEF